MLPVTLLVGKAHKRVIGLISGTSLDGIDAAVVDIDGWGENANAQLVAFETFAYAPALRERIYAATQNRANVADVCQLSFDVGSAFADAAVAVAEKVTAAKPVDLVASHGQTIWHIPPTQYGMGSTLQIGEPAVIAARTGIVTVADFRVADMAVMGQGAPLVPYADWALFRESDEHIALLNVGGISNITFLSGAAAQTTAFDCGPGNVLIDMWTAHMTSGQKQFDEDGHLARQGTCQNDLLQLFLSDPYLQRPTPKSTGREYYNQNWLDQFPVTKFAPQDVLATLVAFTAEAIAVSIRQFAPTRPEKLIASGGGVHNLALMTELAARVAPVTVSVLDHPTITADAKEAVAFALFGVNTVHNVPSNLPGVTAAHRPAVLGKICLPPLAR